jgi:hypothetical protein
MTAGPETYRERIVGVRRRIRATRAFLYAAWTDPHDSLIGSARKHGPWNVAH